MNLCFSHKFSLILRLFGVKTFEVLILIILSNIQSSCPGKSFWNTLQDTLPDMPSHKKVVSDTVLYIGGSIRSAGGTRHCLDITCAAGRPSSLGSLSFWLEESVSIICHTPVTTSIYFKPQLNIQSRYNLPRFALRGGEFYWYFQLAHRNTN